MEVVQSHLMKTVILVGSGHAHLEIVKAFSRNEIAKHRFILISPNRQTYYSGLIPRLITGEIEDKQLTINSAELAESKGFVYIQDEVLSVDQKNNSVTLRSGAKIHFDLLSMNVGGTPTPIPTESPSHTINLRPFNEFLQKWRDIQRIADSCQNPRFVVVGGGAAAVEVAATLQIRLNKNQAKKGEVHLVTKGLRLCENYSEKISEKLKHSLLKSGITIHFNETVDQIFNNFIRLNHGEELRFNSIFIVTPTQPSKIISGKVDSKLRLSSNIFAVGDGTEMLEHPHLPRSGVIAVHQGRHLAQSIRNGLIDVEPADFKVKSKQLNILITGQNCARLVWGNFSFEGRWPLRIKNWIDKRYMKGFEL